MACSGNCTFESSLQYSVLNGEVAQFQWSSGHSAMQDCQANIGNGAGWFRFQRVAGRLQRIDRNRIIGADPAHGGSGTLGQPQPDGSRTLTGGGLPPGVGITVAPGGDYTGIQVAAAGTNPQLLTIDINVALETTCSCQGNTKNGELHVRLHYDLNLPRASQLRHNGTRQAGPVPPPGQGRTMTMQWRHTDVCNTTATAAPHVALLMQWEALTDLPNPTPEQQQDLQTLERRLEAQDRSLTQDRIASAGQHLWWGDGSSALASAAGRLLEAYRAGKIASLDELERELKRIYSPDSAPSDPTQQRKA